MTKKNSNCCKGIAIILVYVHHLFYQVLDIEFLPIEYGVLIPNNDILSIYGFLAKVCVTIFVFLSGYGTAKSYIQKKFESENQLDIIRYTVKRYISLLMSFQFIYIIFFIPTVVQGRIHEVYGEGLLGFLFLLFDFFGLANVAGTATYNGTWWYMSFALMLILILPFAIKICRKYGFLVLALEFFLIRYLNVDFTFKWYMFAVFLGVLFAQNQVFEKITAYYEQSSIIRKFCIIAVFLCGITVGLKLKLHSSAELWDIIESFITVFLCALVCIIIDKIPVVNDILCFLGKHSMNMFLTHSFIYYYWFRAHTYSFHYPVLIVVVLALETVLISVAVEHVKKAMKYDRFVTWVCNKVMVIM